MKALTTSYGVPFIIDDFNIVRSIGDVDFVSHYFEIKLDKVLVESFEEYDYPSAWVSSFIESMGLLLPPTVEEFEKFLHKNWGNWPVQGWVIQAAQPRYKFAEKVFALDMRDYYGNKSKRRGILRGRWDIPYPEVEVLIKDRAFVDIEFLNLKYKQL